MQDRARRSAARTMHGTYGTYAGYARESTGWRKRGGPLAVFHGIENIYPSCSSAVFDGAIGHYVMRSHCEFILALHRTVAMRSASVSQSMGAMCFRVWVRCVSEYGCDVLILMYLRH